MGRYRAASGGWCLCRLCRQREGGDVRYDARAVPVQSTASGVEYQVIKPGDGPRPTASDIALVDYKGSLTNGTVFDASKPGRPAAMPVAAVVPGFREALMLMPKGATYRVWIPPKLGYGPNDTGPIPGNSVLVFDLTLDEMLRSVELFAAHVMPALRASQRTEELAS